MNDVAAKRMLRVADDNRVAAWRGFAVRHTQVVVGGGILLTMAVVAALAPWLGTVDPRAMAADDRLAGMSWIHPFGADPMGRDLYSRMLFGARVSLTVGGVTALLSALFGTFLGMVAAASKITDNVVMRAMDAMMSIPPILLAIALMSVAGGSIENVITAITLVETPRVARLIRGLVLSLREQPYVEAAIAAGSSRRRIVVRHLLPSVVAPLVVQSTSVWAAAMMIEAALSFIGAGITPTTPSWGNIMAEARSLWQIKPTLIFLPALFLSVTVLGVNLLGEGLRRALDPRRKH